MAYLIDTCIVSELRKSKRNQSVADWMAAADPEDLFLSVITLGEIRRGVELLRSKDPKAAGGIENWLYGMEKHYAGRILPVTARIADRWGRLSPTQAIPVMDGLIAATALEHNLTVVTRNLKDFKRTGALTLDPHL